MLRAPFQKCQGANCAAAVLETYRESANVTSHSRRTGRRLLISALSKRPHCRPSCDYSVACDSSLFGPGNKHAPCSRLRVMCEAKKKKAEKVVSDDDEPWLGAVLFSPLVNQSEYFFVTSLERLGLADLSSDLSKAEALAWLQAKKDPASESLPSPEDRTLVLIHMDVIRSGKDLAAEGVVETVFGLQCTRCLAATTYRVKATYQLLLSSTPVLEPTLRSMGVVIGDGRWDNEDVEEGFLDGTAGAGSKTGLLDLDLDDKIYFPVADSSVDLSKYFRDTVHLELPLKLLCSNECKGMCFNCGKNLNLRNCSCAEDDDGLTGSGPGISLKGQVKGSLAEQLREQLRRREKGWA